jgi:hypothetical protein
MREPLLTRGVQNPRPKPIFPEKVLPPYRGRILLRLRNDLQGVKRHFFYKFLTR